MASTKWAWPVPATPNSSAARPRDHPASPPTRLRSCPRTPLAFATSQALSTFLFRRPRQGSRQTRARAKDVRFVKHASKARPAAPASRSRAGAQANTGLTANWTALQKHQRIAMTTSATTVSRTCLASAADNLGPLGTDPACAANRAPRLLRPARAVAAAETDLTCLTCRSGRVPARRRRPPRLPHRPGEQASTGTETSASLALAHDDNSASTQAAVWLATTGWRRGGEAATAPALLLQA
jgi:hypothetical protein